MAKKGEEIVDISVTIEHDTGAAWKVTSHLTNRTAWIAYQMAEMHEYSPSTRTATLTLPTHIAEEKELI